MDIGERVDRQRHHHHLEDQGTVWMEVLMIQYRLRTREIRTIGMERGIRIKRKRGKIRGKVIVDQGMERRRKRRKTKRVNRVIDIIDFLRWNIISSRDFICE